MRSTPITELLKRPIAWRSWQSDRTVRHLLASLQVNVVKGHGREYTRNLFWSFESADQQAFCSGTQTQAASGRGRRSNLWIVSTGLFKDARTGSLHLPHSGQ